MAWRRGRHVCSGVPADNRTDAPPVAALPSLTRCPTGGRPARAEWIIYVIRHGVQWRDVPGAYGPHKTLHNRFIRWSRLGVFDRIFAALAAEVGTPERVMIDSAQLKAHRTAARLLAKGAFPRCIGRTKGGLNSKLHAVYNQLGRPLIMLLTEG